MPLVPSSNLRLVQQPENLEPDTGDQMIDVQDAEEADPSHKLDAKGNVIEIKYPDGSIAISLDGSSLDPANDAKSPKGWFDNLVDDLSEGQQSIIVEDLLRGIENDKETRQEWVETRAQGIKLLGLQIELPGTTSSADGAPVEGMSKVRHPLLQEAVLRFQANSRSELLPTDGPVKIREDNNNATEQSDELANALEDDFNHYLTTTASEYYPDTDRMLLLLGFGGSAFKKVYFCPLRNRPVSESVDADDLIVNNATTDLKNAKRVTHRIMMRDSTVKRMQIIGAYADVDLGQVAHPSPDSVQREKKAQEGVAVDAANPEDNDREIFECYCELNVPGFEHKKGSKETGLEVPYRVTMDVSSKKMLALTRNFDKETEKLPEPKETFVHYVFVPGFGFYGIGLLHILGNTTNAITAAWREALDAGMFANFPGFLLADTGARQNTTIFRVPPGGSALVKTNGVPLKDAIMPLPYKEASPGFIAFIKDIAETGMRVGGTAEQAVGEGKQDAPVGTTLALIDQATKVLNSVHKRCHAAQAHEFQLLKECFKENPESFWQQNRRPARKWDQETFLRAINNNDLVPQADPNTASQTQRIMKVVALKQLQAANQALYDPIAVDTAAMRALGWSNPEQFFVPKEKQTAPPPEMLKEIQDMANKTEVAKSQANLNNAKAQEALHPQPEASGLVPPDPLKVKALQLKERQLDEQGQRAMIDDVNRDKDRQADLAESHMELEGDLVKAHVANEHDHLIQSKEHQQARIEGLADRMHEHVQGAHDRAAQLAAARAKPKPAKPKGKGK